MDEISAEDAAPTLGPPPLPETAVDEKIRTVMSALSDAVTAIVTSDSPSKFAQAARICGMGQKLAVELIQSASAANQMRRYHPGGADYGQGFVGAVGYDLPDNVGMGQYIAPAPLGDGPELQRNLMMMLQSWFEEQKQEKKERAARLDQIEAQDARGKLYTDLAAAMELRKNLTETDEALRQHLEHEISALTTALFTDPKEIHGTTDPDLVSAELLRRHPPRARLEPGDPPDPRGPVLHREDRHRGADEGGPARGDLQAALE